MRIASTQAESELFKLKDKEQQAYIALSTLVDLLQGYTKHIHDYKATTDFERYKRVTLIRTTQLNLNHYNNPCSTQENHFNIMHYQRAILSASRPTYRNMVILTAKHTLTQSAIANLLNSMKKYCIKLSKETKVIERRWILSTTQKKSPSLATEGP